MTDIEIPADIVDAGARAYAADTYRGTRGLDGGPVVWDTLTDTDRAACTWKARVVLAAALPLLAEVAASAWDEGFTAGVNTDMGDYEHPPEVYANPYRTGADQ